MNAFVCNVLMYECPYARIYEYLHAVCMFTCVLYVCILSCHFILFPMFIILIFRLGFCPCPVQWGWQHQAMLNTGSPSISVLWVNSSPATITDISLDTFRPVFLGLPFPLGLGNGRSVTDFRQDVAHCTCPYHLSRPLQRNAVISLLPSFWSSQTEDVSTRSLVPQIQWIIARSLQWYRLRSKMFGPHVSLPWSITERTQAVYHLPCTLYLRRQVPGGEDR